jgi:hypothetical protein
MCRQVSGLDDLARIFFPDNKNHRRAFLALWVEIKYADAQFLPSREDIAGRHGVSRRPLDTVRAKMKRLGLIKRISHFNPAYGHEAGWTFCNRFLGCLSDFRTRLAASQEVSGRPVDEKKDRDCALYL